MGLLIAEILSHLFRHRARTLLTLSGLSVGILALTLLGSLGEAVNVSLDQQEAAALSMFEVRPSTWERHLTPAVRRAIRHVPGVAGTLTSLWADLIPPEEKQETGFAFTVEALMAVDSDIPGLERSLAPHDASLHRGRWPARGATNEVLLDFDLASVRGWDVGDTVGIRGRPFVVTGILERPRLGSNARYAYVDYEALRNLLHLPADNLQTLYVIPEPGQDAAAREGPLRRLARCDQERQTGRLALRLRRAAHGDRAAREYRQAHEHQAAVGHGEDGIHQRARGHATRAPGLSRRLEFVGRDVPPARCVP